MPVPLNAVSHTYKTSHTPCGNIRLQETSASTVFTLLHEACQPMHSLLDNIEAHYVLKKLLYLEHSHPPEHISTYLCRLVPFFYVLFKSGHSGHYQIVHTSHPQSGHIHSLVFIFHFLPGLESSNLMQKGAIILFWVARIVPVLHLHYPSSCSPHLFCPFQCSALPWSLSPVSLFHLPRPQI